MFKYKRKLGKMERLKKSIDEIRDEKVKDGFEGYLIAGFIVFVFTILFIITTGY